MHPRFVVFQLTYMFCETKYLPNEHRKIFVLKVREREKPHIQKFITQILFYNINLFIYVNSVVDRNSRSFILVLKNERFSLEKCVDVAVNMDLSWTNKSIATKKTLIKSFNAVFVIEWRDLILTCLIIEKCAENFVFSVNNMKTSCYFSEAR